MFIYKSGMQPGGGCPTTSGWRFTVMKLQWICFNGGLHAKGREEVRSSFDLLLIKFGWTRYHTLPFQLPFIQACCINSPLDPLNLSCPFFTISEANANSVLELVSVQSFPQATVEPHLYVTVYISAFPAKLAPSSSTVTTMAPYFVALQVLALV